MNCPVCDGKLAPTEVDGIAVDRCGVCHGLWIGEEGLRLAKDAADENLVWFDLDLWSDRQHFSIREKGGPCPTCDARLYRVRYTSPDAPQGSVDIEYCRHCRAIWLGEGELESIVRALEGEVARMSSGELLRKALKEAVEVMRGPEPLALEWRDLSQLLQLVKGRFFVEHPRLEKLIEEFTKSTPFS